MTTLASTVRSVLLSASEIGSPHKLRRDSILFRQDQDGMGVFLIDAGLVKLTRTSNDGSKLILSVLGPHQLLGDECLMQGSGKYFAEYACVTDVSGFHVPLSALRRLITVPELAISFLSYVLARNREFGHKVEMLALRDVEHRILYGLATLAALVKPNGNGASYPIPMTQAELASFVGATRETTSTTLSLLKNRHLVSLSRRLITTVHPDLLIKAANERMVQVKAAS